MLVRDFDGSFASSKSVSLHDAKCGNPDDVPGLQQALGNMPHHEASAWEQFWMQCIWLPAAFWEALWSMLCCAKGVAHARASKGLLPGLYRACLFCGGGPGDEPLPLVLRRHQKLEEWKKALGVRASQAVVTNLLTLPRNRRIADC
jgi:hypothetical protein